MEVSYPLYRPNQLSHIALLITYIQAQTQTCPWRPWDMHISPSHTTHTLSVLSSSGIYRILIIMKLETDKTYAHVMGCLQRSCTFSSIRPTSRRLAIRRPWLKGCWTTPLSVAMPHPRGKVARTQQGKMVHRMRTNQQGKPYSQ